MSGSLSGMHVLVTGGGSGIARAAAERYHREGAVVTVLNRSRAGADAVRATSGGGIHAIVGDATDPEALRRAISEAVDTEGRLHHLTCGVGVFDGYARVSELSAEALMVAAEESWRVNVRSTLLAVNLAAPALRAARGSITLTLSESAFNAIGGGALYGSSKWALRGIVDHLSAELAPEIRVNGVAPGGTGGTRFGGLQSIGQTATADQVDGRDERIAAQTLLGVTAMPADHSGAYRFLADPVDARVITGVVIRSDGGRRL
ncbi:SDR family NAD(P)-dependent oxidoreductase [Leucobacter triazinivorans]|uniref:SDR family NAD(P)-dependent oxidoreductase n=1 Tax=Leucobacter triazinivorans TaxID=1784719 RepID=A0A4P6KDR4_9MICO|nr:SDR family NAD(P)-dependent oxidoreductase [Leucobacter triazinivorans]QBE48071.1 SDR family NAD(P)-dependent oxidoreductase [Leucobacter triazinivorans]